MQRRSILCLDEPSSEHLSGVTAEPEAEIILFRIKLFAGHRVGKRKRKTGFRVKSHVVGRDRNTALSVLEIENSEGVFVV